jgi:hypothetical protein
MTEEEKFEETGSSQQDYSENWKEIGDNFKSLGRSLAMAFRQTWENEELRQQMRKSLDSLADGINAAVKEVSESDQGKQVREEMEKAAQSAQTAGTQAYRDVKPQIVSSLRQLDIEFQKMIDRLEKEEATSSAATESDDDEAEETG